MSSYNTNELNAYWLLVFREEGKEETDRNYVYS